LFLFNEHTECETHETFKCKRCKHGKQVIKAPALLYGDASTRVSSLFWHSQPYLMLPSLGGIISLTENWGTTMMTYSELRLVNLRYHSFSNTSVIRSFPSQT
jgi:hypothetical protein